MISTARCVAGSFCSVATNASSTLSRQLVARRRVRRPGLVGELGIGIRLQEHRLGHRRSEIVHRRSGRAVL